MRVKEVLVRFGKWPEQGSKCKHSAQVYELMLDMARRAPEQRSSRFADSMH